MLSLLFPGLGDFYLGHRLFALVEMFGAGFLWCVLVIVPLLARGQPDPETGEPLVLGAAYWGTVAFPLSFAHIVDAFMTRHFARKGHHPAGEPAARAIDATFRASA